MRSFVIAIVGRGLFGVACGVSCVGCCSPLGDNWLSVRSFVLRYVLVVGLVLRRLLSIVLGCCVLCVMRCVSVVVCCC